MTKELEIKRAAILAELTSINDEIATAITASRAGGIASVRALMTEHGLTVSDLGPIAAVARDPKSAKTASVAMYRNETGQTYAGRGKRPHWLRDALAAGRTLESFRIGA